MEDGYEIGQLNKSSDVVSVNGVENEYERFNHLEMASRELHFEGEELNRVSTEVLEYIFKFSETISSMKAYENNVHYDKDKLAISSNGRNLKEVIYLFHTYVVRSGINKSSGRDMAYIPSGAIPLSAFGDFLAAFTNKFTGHYHSCPGGVNLENHILEWMASLFGFDTTTSGGNLCSGSSIATIMCVAAARDKYGLKARDYESAVIYTSEEAHFCLEKALRLVGMRESMLQKIPVDANHSIDTLVLEATLLEDIKKGLRPFLIVGTLGITTSGSVDNIEKLSALAKKFDCWLHVDAAYGGFFCLLDEMKEHFLGVENADSLSLDPHKSLFLPYGSGIALVKQREHLVRTFDYFSDYIEDSNSINYSPADVSPELTRHFRGLRIWFPLMHHGVERFENALREKVQLSRYAYEKMKEMNFIELGPSPPLTVFLFRFNGNGVYDNKQRDGKTLNALNKEMKESIQDDGRVFITSAILNGVFWLRVAVLCIRTHKTDIDTLLDIVQFMFNQRCSF